MKIIGGKILRLIILEKVNVLMLVELIGQKGKYKKS